MLRCPTCGSVVVACESDHPVLSHVRFIECGACGQQYNDGCYNTQEDKELLFLDDIRND